MNGYCKLLLKTMNEHEWELALGKTFMSTDEQMSLMTEIHRLKNVLNEVYKVNLLGTFRNTEYGVVKTWRKA